MRVHSTTPPLLTHSCHSKHAARSLSGNYAEAQKQYDTGFIHIFTQRDEWNYILSDEEKEKIKACKLPLHLNRAMAKLKQNKYDDALWDCDQALEIDADSEKGRFRRACVYLEKTKEQLAKEKEGKFWDVEKTGELLAKGREDMDAVLGLRGDDGSSDKGVRRKLAEYTRARAELDKRKREFEGQRKKFYRDDMFGYVRICEWQDWAMVLRSVMWECFFLCRCVCIYLLRCICFYRYYDVYCCHPPSHSTHTPRPLLSLFYKVFAQAKRSKTGGRGQTGRGDCAAGGGGSNRVC